MPRITAPDILKMKGKGEKIAMLTAYDYPMANMADAAGVDMVLVGDS
ncbi:MAG TPA: 3-methyl-2-oxobutanoate hydroxymethyltransferase, partial [Myxococcota bacterium]|nr:3-methyl-2-oxobutanoate hydroxymethyltransferase [Myxococcota bacterium]